MLPLVHMLQVHLKILIHPLQQLQLQQLLNLH